MLHWLAAFARCGFLAEVVCERVISADAAISELRSVRSHFRGKRVRHATCGDRRGRKAGRLGSWPIRAIAGFV